MQNQNPISKPELLAPAGNLEKLQIAFLNGADAVYLSLHQLGLRKYADNFSFFHYIEALKIAQMLKKKVYLAINGFSHQSDINTLKCILPKLVQHPPDAVIVADIGVAQLIKDASLPIHISTQVSVTNAYHCEFWKQLGAKRVVLARELSIKEIAQIRQSVDIELEVFIHGSMCAGYSGKCVISNFTSLRDANRGGCIQNCRHLYLLKDIHSKQSFAQLHLLNARDLMGVSSIFQLIQAGVCSFKIEGRMKSNLYLANSISQYRKLMDTRSKPNYRLYQNALKQISNRTFGNGFMKKPHNQSLQNIHFNGYQKSYQFIGTVKAVHHTLGLVVEVKNTFYLKDQLEIQQKDGRWKRFKVKHIQNMNNDNCQEAPASSLICLPWLAHVRPFSILRKHIIDSD